MAKTANDVIPFTLFRQMIQDNPKRGYENIITNGVYKVFGLSNYPVLIGMPMSFKVNGQDGSPTIDAETGQLFFDSALAAGNLEADYYYAQLSDSTIEDCLNSALIRHDDSLTWDTIPNTQVPFVELLAAASAFYALAAKWATEARVRVEDIETFDGEVGTKYFLLAKEMENRYNDAILGRVDARTATRRAVSTGQLVFIPEGDG